MPTAEQLRLRRTETVRYANLIAEDKEKGLTQLEADISSRFTKENLRVDILTLCLARNIITAEDVPPKLAPLVAEKFLKGAADRERDDAADKGTEVHELAERLTQGELVDIPEELEGHVRSWMKFRDDYGLNFLDTEFTVFSPTYGYAGTGDFLGFSELHPEWGLICGDYKTSKSGIWPDIALQLAALKYADFIGRCKSCPHPEGETHPLEDLWEDRSVLTLIKTCIGVQITTEGYMVVPVRVTEGTFRIFKSAINVARWKRDYEGLALDPKAEFIRVTEDS